MSKSRVIKTSLLLLLSSAAAPAMAADMDVYGNPPPPPQPSCCAPPQASDSAYPVTDGGYGAGAADWQSAVVVPQQPLSGGPDAPESPHLRRAASESPYDVNGYDDGAITLKPTLQIGTIYSNNVNLTHDNRKSDVGVELRPSFTWDTKWPVNNWSGGIYADVQRFSDTPEANRITGAGETTYRVDIRRDTYAEFGANFAVTADNPGSADVPSDATEARQDIGIGASAGIAHDFGWFQGKATLGVTRANFTNVHLSGGGIEQNSDMNYTSPTIILRGTIGSNGARVRPYAQISYDWRLHDEYFDRNGLRRDSQGFGAALGLVLNDGPIWSGDIAAVMMYRHFEDASLTDALVPGVAATINWSPMPLWTIVANTGVAVNDSNVSGISSSALWTGGLTATYAVRDNVNLRAGASMTVGTDDSGSGVDIGNIVQAGADWQVNPHMVFSGTLQSTWYHAPDETASYDEQRAFVGVTLKP